MKVALVCPSNLIHMPYVDNYIKFLRRAGVVHLTVINWDRFNIEQEGYFCFRDGKSGHARGFIDYVKYASFVRGRLRQGDFDRVVIFGLQLMFFLDNYLVKNFRGKYVFDVRDYNVIKRISSFSRAVEGSAFTVISSPGFATWLPKSGKYVVNHNANIDDLNALGRVRRIDPEHVDVSCIGALKDFYINKKLVDKLSGQKAVSLSFRGEGVINEALQSYVDRDFIGNVEISGRYIKSEEEGLYARADIINMFMTPNRVNNNTCLSNRLYNASIFGRPLIALKGSLISDLIADFGLGLVVTTFDDLDKQIVNYASSYKPESFDLARRHFLSRVLKENAFFYDRLGGFLA